MIVSLFEKFNQMNKTLFTFTILKKTQTEKSAFNLFIGVKNK